MRFNPGCACCPEADCCGCAAVPTTWTYPLAMTDASMGDLCGSGCPTCNDFDSTYTLLETATECRWYNYESPVAACTSGSAGSNGSCAADPFVMSELYCDGTDWILWVRLFMRIAGLTSGGLPFDNTFTAGDAIYKKSVATWNCLAANTLTQDEVSSTGCTGFPATITITP